jgi:endonuclease/exonuclease/phosphatase family metal-dependent hydrolase
MPRYYIIFAVPKLFLFLILTFFCQQGEAQRLRVMSYNIHIGQDASGKDQLAELAKYIKASDADILGLQEVDSVCIRSGKVDQMAFLAQATGMHYAYQRHFSFDGGSYGIGILSNARSKGDR